MPGILQDKELLSKPNQSHVTVGHCTHESCETIHEEYFLR